MPLDAAATQTQTLALEFDVRQGDDACHTLTPFPNHLALSNARPHVFIEHCVPSQATNPCNSGSLIAALLPRPA